MPSLGRTHEGNGFEIRDPGRTWFPASCSQDHDPQPSVGSPRHEQRTPLREVAGTSEQTSAAEGSPRTVGELRRWRTGRLAARVEALSASSQVWSPMRPTTPDRGVLALMAGSPAIQGVAGRFMVPAASGRGLCRASLMPGPTVNRRRLQTSPGRLVVSTPVCRV